jgi:hypothetical protein
MMEARGWLGLPFLAWGAICLALALVWAFVYPAAPAANAAGLRLFLIRWGHALVWALLAAMCLLRATGQPALVRAAGPVGLAALLVYLSFLGATFVLR